MSEEKKRKVSWATVWRESKEIIWARRYRLVVGLVLLIISRLAGMVLPGTTKVLIDDVIGQGRGELLWLIAGAAGVATVIQAITSFNLAILLGVAGQRAITDLRLKVQQHIGHLPVSFYEENKSGELISRIMYDAEGIRNLVGTGFVQLVGGMFTVSGGLGCPAVVELASDGHDSCPVLFFFGIDHGDGLQPIASHFSRAGQDQRRGHRSAWQRP